MLLLVIAVVPCRAAADTITLNNGRVIQADRAWYEGSQVRYQKNGGTYGLPRELVKEVSQSAAPEPAADPGIAEAQRLLIQDPAEARRLLKAAVARDPRSIPAMQGLSEASLRVGDLRAARESAQKAIALDDRNARSHTLLGDVLVAMGDRASAEAEYRRSVSLRPDADVERRLEALAPAPAGPQFRIRYDGSVNEPLGMAVLQSMMQAHQEYARRLGFTPAEPVTIVLQTETGLPDEHIPEWAAGVNDGSIRVPVQGLDRPTPRLLAVLRHELAHSFISARTGGNCPTWLQEGISQWLEGGDPGRDEATVARAAQAGRLIPLATLEAPFQNLPPTDVSLAYAESLSAIAYILERSGEAGVVRLLSALADRLPSEEALPVALALSYPEFQRNWEEDLKKVPLGR